MGVRGRSPHLLIHFQSPAPPLCHPALFRKTPGHGPEFRGSPVKLSNFSKNVRQCYPTFRKSLPRVIGRFQKKFVEVRGFLENMRGQNAPPHVRLFRQPLPDFQKNVGKVTDISRDRSPCSANFSKIVRQRYQNFRKSRKIPVNILSGQRGGEGYPPHPVCVQGEVTGLP